MVAILFSPTVNEAERPKMLFSTKDNKKGKEKAPITPNMATYTPSKQMTSLDGSRSDTENVSKNSKST